tara:strand:- start:325 stop:555 length:231 start_codon:yes stop_codon:yes gene_type:complete
MNKKGNLRVRRIEQLLDEMKEGDKFGSKAIGDLYCEKYGVQYLPSPHQIAFYLRRIPTCEVWGQRGKKGEITWVKV